MNRISYVASAVLLVTDALVDARIGFCLLIQDAWTARRDEEGLTPVFVTAMAPTVIWLELALRAAIHRPEDLAVTFAFAPAFTILPAAFYIGHIYIEGVLKRSS